MPSKKQPYSIKAVRPRQQLLADALYRGIKELESELDSVMPIRKEDRNRADIAYHDLISQQMLIWKKLFFSFPSQVRRCALQKYIQQNLSLDRSLSSHDPTYPKMERRA
jgi:hypothetical protein